MLDTSICLSTYLFIPAASLRVLHHAPTHGEDRALAPALVQLLALRQLHTHSQPLHLRAARPLVCVRLVHHRIVSSIRSELI